VCTPGQSAEINCEKITAEKAANRKVIETVTASGKIQPETEVKLSSEVSGEVTELLVKEGDIVKKGQLLVKYVQMYLSQDMIAQWLLTVLKKQVSLASAQQLKQSEANFANEEITYKRNQELFKKKVISASEFDAAKNAYLTAKTNLGSSKEDLIAAKFRPGTIWSKCSGSKCKPGKSNHFCTS
jgi:HlyD family secretion protein